MHIPARKDRGTSGPKIVFASSGAQRPDTHSVSTRREDGVTSHAHQCDDMALSPSRKTEEPKSVFASSGAQRPDTRSVSARRDDGVASHAHQGDDIAHSREKDTGTNVWTLGPKITFASSKEMHFPASKTEERLDPQDQARIKRGTKDPIHVLSQRDDDDVMMGTNDVCTPINAMRMATSCLQLIRTPGPIGGQSQ